MRIHDPPQSWNRLRWLGPGFLWMVSAAGSGELLFTPRIAAQYGYALLWAVFIAVGFKWLINREIGRLACASGMPFLHAVQQARSKSRFLLLFLAVPQFFVAVATIAGLASAAATAVVLLLPGSAAMWASVLILGTTALNVWAGYRLIERGVTVLGIVLAIAVAAAAASVLPEPGKLAAGLAPRIDAGMRYDEILPWLGFMLSGAAGLMWYSSWVTTRGYGAAQPGKRTRRMQDVDAADVRRLQGWIRQITLDTSVAVVGVLLIVLSFLILGAELLRPDGLVPKENEIAGVLGQLLGKVWGPVGYWFMVIALLVGFAGTVLTGQDGFTRFFVDATRNTFEIMQREFKSRHERIARATFLIGLTAIAPAVLLWVVGDPVTLLKAAGAIEAIHIPVVTCATLYLNRRLLPSKLQPSWPIFALMILAALFFTTFAGIYLWQLASAVNTV